jgi:hypothetical protein
MSNGELEPAIDALARISGAKPSGSEENPDKR